MKGYIKLFGITIISIVLSLVIVSAMTWDPIAYYSFNETTGASLPDISYKGDGDGNLINMENGDWVGGRLGNALLFDGTDEFVNITNTTLYNFTATGEFSFSIWVNRTVNSGAVDGIIGASLASRAGAFTLMNDNTEETRISARASSEALITPSFTMPLNRWQHYVLVYNGTGIAYYINGTIVGHAALSGIPEYTNQPMMIGRAYWAALTYFQGVVDEYGVWQRALTPTEVGELYNSGAGLEPGDFQEPVSPGTLAINLNQPTNGSFIVDDLVFNATINPSNMSLINATLQVWYLNNSLAFQNTNSISGTARNDTTFNVTNDLLGTFDWNVYACGYNNTGIFCSRSATNNTYTFGYVLNSETFDATVGDLSNTTITIAINLSDNVLTSSASLVYDNVSYSSTKSESGGVTSFSSVIDIGAVSTSTTKYFHWRFTLADSQTTVLLNSSQQSQTVDPSEFGACGGSLVTPAVVYWFLDEETNASVNTTDFDATFTYYLSGGDTTKNTSVALGSELSYDFCINPNATYVTTAEIRATADGYATRIFTLNDQLYSNNITNQYLYMLNSSDATTVRIEVTDPGFVPLEGYTVRIFRKDEGTGTYVLVQQDVTDIFGQVVAKLVEDDIKYRMEFYNTDNTLVQSTGDLIISCRSTICVYPIIIESEPTDLDRYDDLENYDGEIVYDNSTRQFIFTWNDNRGEDPIVHNLLVRHRAFNGTSVVCNYNSTALSGSLTCSLGDVNGTYSAQGFRHYDGDSRRIDSITQTLGQILETGLEGLMISFILLFTFVIVGIFSPAIGLVLYFIGFIILGIAGIIYMPWYILVGQAVIGGILIWALRN